MKANVDTVLVGSQVVLVPYRPEHVAVRGRHYDSDRYLSNSCVFHWILLLSMPSKTEVSWLDA